jgi:hypothetical protein
VPHPIRPELREVDPITMRRRAMIASLLGITTTAALPGWAEAAARTPDMDHTTTRGSWAKDFTDASWELDTLGARYVTHEGALDRHTIMETGLWLAAQLAVLAERAPASHRSQANRAAAEACAFAAGCYIDFGNNKAATDLYDKGYRLASDHPDLRAFIFSQWNWVPMYRGEWHKVARRSDTATGLAEVSGGFGLLMGYAHRAKAHAVFGNTAQALSCLDTMEKNLARVPGAHAPHSALRYSASKAWFSASTVYAELGDTQRQEDAQYRALEDPTLGWIDRNLMKLGQCSLDPDPEQAAHRIRFHVLSLPRDGFNHCVKAEADRLLNKLSGRRGAGREVAAAKRYLTTVVVDPATAAA